MPSSRFPAVPCALIGALAFGCSSPSSGFDGAAGAATGATAVRYDSHAPPVIAQTCAMQLTPPPGNVREDMDDLLALAIPGLNQKGYVAMAQSRFIQESTVPLTTVADMEKTDPTMLEFGGQLLSWVSGWAVPDDPRCGNGFTAVGIAILPDVHWDASGRYERFKDGKPAFARAEGFRCVKGYEPETREPAYSQEDWSKARRDSVPDAVAQMPTCETYWAQSIPAMNVDVVKSADWKAPKTAPLARCHSTDSLDPVRIQFDVLADATHDNSMVGILVTANGKVVATGASVPQVHLVSDSVPKAMVYAPFAYQDTKSNNPNDAWGFSSVFFPKVEATVSGTYDEEYSSGWDNSRKRQITCQFEMARMK